MLADAAATPKSMAYPVVKATQKAAEGSFRRCRDMREGSWSAAALCRFRSKQTTGLTVLAKGIRLNNRSL
jgi:hypothetical protein